MLVTKIGLIKAKRRLQRLTAEYRDTKKESAEMFEEGNTWHDNPMWDDAERRAKILASEIEMLRRAINECRLVTRPTTHYQVSVGHRVDFFDGRGRTSSVIILGPLDVDLGDHIISYDSPVAMALLGQALGTDVPFQGGIMTIENITSWEGFE